MDWKILTYYLKLCMKNLLKTLTEDTGYYVLESFIPKTLIVDFKERLKDLYPVRASSSKKVCI